MIGQAALLGAESTVPAIPGYVWIVGALVFAGIGAAMAKSRGASVIAGAALGLMCGVFGLYFVTRLPVPETLSSDQRRARFGALDEVDPDDGSPIDPEVAAKLGLPPQQGWTADQAAQARVTSVQPSQYTQQMQAAQQVPGAPIDDPALGSYADPSGGGGAIVPINPAVWNPTTAWSPTGDLPAAPEPEPSPEPAPVVEGYWAVDPTGRFAHRWWDGAAWTTRVVGADGIEAVDAAP